MYQLPAEGDFTSFQDGSRENPCPAGRPKILYVELSAFPPRSHVELPASPLRSHCRNTPPLPLPGPYLPSQAVPCPLSSFGSSSPATLPFWCPDRQLRHLPGKSLPFGTPSLLLFLTGLIYLAQHITGWPSPDSTIHMHDPSAFVNKTV